ncbi:MAG: hypothetical protein WBX25_18045 [Rhodomicrobium sp.]
MAKALKAIVIFAAMIAVPIVLDNLISRHPQVPLALVRGSHWLNTGYFGAGVFILAFLIIQFFLLYGRLELIVGWLRLAERDLNGFIAGGWDQTGRKNRAAERAEWNRMAIAPAAQIFEAGYQTVAHLAFEANEKDFQVRGSTLGKARITAFLLRELYQGNVEQAQKKVFGDTRNNGQVPYVAPGIRELIGFDRFSEEAGFEPGAGVGPIELLLTVRLWGFPKEILIVDNKDGVKRRLTGFDVLTELTQHRWPPRT